MKKTIAIILAALLLFSFAACGAPQSQQNGQEPESTPVEVAPGLTGSEYPGVELSIAKMEWDANGLTLHVDWINHTELEGIFGAAYTIERQEGESWVGCERVDIFFDALAYVLSPGQTRREVYQLAGMFDISREGVYRFRSDISIGDKSNLSLWAQFTVGQGQLPQVMEVDFRAQYIRTDGYFAEEAFPKVQIIESVENLQDYYTAYHQWYDLERREQVYSDSTKGFLDACDGYDATFFQERYLILVVLQEGSGSIRHTVNRVEQSQPGQLAVYIDRIVPEVGTDDMAQWHAILEVERSVPVEDADAVSVYVDEKLVFSGSEVVLPVQDAALQAPPALTLYAPDGEATCQAAGYCWDYVLADGSAVNVIQDQASAVPDSDSVVKLLINGKYAETIYAPVPGTDQYAPTNSLGYLVKLGWEAEPVAVELTCWPESYWQDEQTPQETVICQENAFYAWQGSFIYEIRATWDGRGYEGTANYYVLIWIVEEQV